MLLTLSFRNWLFEYFDSQCVYFSLCRSLGDLLDLFSSQLGLSGLKRVWVSFLWEKWQLFFLIRYISRFLGECCTRFKTERQNSERTIALMLSLALEPALQTQTPSGAWQGTGVRGQAGVAPFVFSAAPSTREFGSTYPSKQDSQLWPWGIARPRVAKSSDTLKRCQNETSLCAISELKNIFFFFYITLGRVKQNIFLDQQFAISAPDLSCYPYILFPLIPLIKIWFL